MTIHLLAIDQGTTNSRAIIFDLEGKVVSRADKPLSQFFPKNGWVEQDPIEMFTNTISCMKTALRQANLTAKDIRAIGITNQRETTIIWDKKTGEPIYPAIVWQDRRTTHFCHELSETPLNIEIIKKTGLLLDPYFSVSKILWLLKNVKDARLRAKRGELLFGTVDTFLLWKLTGGIHHKTDASNASRTSLYNIHTQLWDDEILNVLDIPHSLLPKVENCTAAFGEMDESFLGIKIPITGIAGDQHAATFGQACFQPGMVKATFGTGGFMMINSGNNVIESNNKLLSTIAFRIKGHTTYALEGSIFSAGVTVKWLRDQLQVITTAKESEDAANRVENNGGVYFVPAFTGLGAPYWQANARAAILGLTQNSNKNHIVRAGLESVCYQTRDLLAAAESDYPQKLTTLRVDGGMVENNWFLQFLANILQMPIERPHCIETTALGAAYLAGLQAGVYHSLDEISQLWKLEKRFLPQITSEASDELYGEWQRAVKRVI